MSPWCDKCKKADSLNCFAFFTLCFVFEDHFLKIEVKYELLLYKQFCSKFYKLQLVYKRPGTSHLLDNCRTVEWLIQETNFETGGIINTFFMKCFVVNFMDSTLICIQKVARRHVCKKIAWNLKNAILRSQYSINNIWNPNTI